MSGEERMEEDDDDVDFNPYLQRSPSLDGVSVESSDGEGEIEVEEDDGDEGIEEDQFERENFQNSGKDVIEEGHFDENCFLELASDDGEEEDYEDEDHEESMRNAGENSELEIHPRKNGSRGGEGRHFVSDVKLPEGVAKTCGDGDGTARDEHSAGQSALLNAENGNCYPRNMDSSRIAHCSQDGADTRTPSGSAENLPGDRDWGVCRQANEILRGNNSDDFGEGPIDAISKRTRAHYSLADMSLDQLEMFLQESDEEEYFQNVDDEEEYRKFLLAVQEKEDDRGEKCQQQGRNEDEDDEEEDADFELEIEEALESDYDDGSEFLRKRKRRPDTREKRRQRVRIQSKSPHLSQSKAPLRPLLPHMSNMTYGVPILEKNTVTERADSIWPAHAKKKVSVNGFTAHQIGQLYCLIHEHVQLLVQIFSMCILEPARQQQAIDTHRMLMEMVEKRDLLLSWKKTAFPDFCFRPPYTHPSFTEIEESNQMGPSNVSGSSSARPGENTNGISNVQLGNLPHGSVGDFMMWNSGSSSTSFQNLPLTSLGPSVKLNAVTEPPLGLAPQSCSFPVTMEPGTSAVDHSAMLANFSQQSPRVPHSWHPTISPFNTHEAPQTRQIVEIAGPVHSWAMPRASSNVPLTRSKDATASSIPLGSAHEETSLQVPGNSGLNGKQTNSSIESSESVSLQVCAYYREGSLKDTARIKALHPTTTFMSSLCSSASLSSKNAQMFRHPAGEPCGNISEWAPATSGPVRSLLDVAPLALVRDFLNDMSRVVEEYRQRHVESGAYHSQCEREPLFLTSIPDEREANVNRKQNLKSMPSLPGHGEALPAALPRLQVKKTMAAALVESTKKQSLALVPKDVSIAVQRFLPFFNKALFPHKPPPIAAANRLLFTDSEDELLAMGLMMYNTDWKAIQQRFLPSKSMHQIFVRQKNRSSARAPENSIKAVRRMKSSPLTAAEKGYIQEGLRMYKYDWNKVWEHCVPHRDPAVLPRQWRIALGTQKSYKTSETSKERRRVYEANRRQMIAAKKANDTCFQANKEAGASFFGAGVECRDATSGEEDGDESEDAFIREAFLADWFPNTSLSIGAASVPGPAPAEPSGERQMTNKPSVCRKRKARVESLSRVKTVSSEPSSHLLPNSSSLFNPPATMFSCKMTKQTVKLAPGLPSVKLPPHVHVLSQSHVQTVPPRLLSVTSYWPQIGGQGLENTSFRDLSSSLPSSSLSRSTRAVRLHEKGVSSLHRMTLAGSHRSHKQGLSSQKDAGSGLNELANSVSEASDLHPQEIANLLDKKLETVPLSSSSFHQGGPVALHSRLEPVLVQDLSSEGSSAKDVGIATLKQAGPQFHPFFGASRERSSVLRFDSASPRGIKKMMVTPCNQFGRNSQPPSTSGEVVATESVHSDISDRVVSETQVNVSDTTDDMPLASTQDHHTVQLSKQDSRRGSVSQLSVDCQQTRVSPSKVVPIVQVAVHSTVQSRTDLMDGEVAKGRREDILKQRASMGKRKLEKRSKRLVCAQQNGKTTQNLNTRDRREKTLQHVAPVSVEECQTHEGAIRSTQPRVIDAGMVSNKRRYSKVQEGRIETGNEDPHSEAHVIVMEQEELSDSEDEADIGVQFEHEEMGDSDKDTDLELHTSKHSKECNIEFEEEEIGSDREREEDHDIVGCSRERSKERLELPVEGLMNAATSRSAVKRQKLHLKRSVGQKTLRFRTSNRKDLKTTEDTKTAECSAQKTCRGTVPGSSGKQVGRAMQAKTGRTIPERRESGSSSQACKKRGPGFAKKASAWEDKGSEVENEEALDETAFEAARVLAVIYQIPGIARK